MATSSATLVPDCKHNSNHFFKVLVSGYSHKLYIPNAFIARNLSGINIEESGSTIAILNSDKGNWHVKLRRDAQHKCMWFEQGWEDFVKDHKLYLGDILVFEHTGDLVFHVLLFDPSACEKEYHTSNITIEPSSSKAPVVVDKNKHLRAKPNVNKRGDPFEAAEAYTCKSCQHPNFIAEITAKHLYGRQNLHVPIEFARVNELCDIQNGSVAIRDHQRNLYWFGLIHTSNGSRVRFGRGKDWIKFLKSNDVKAGDVCVFELPKTKTNIIFDVLIFKT